MSVDWTKPIETTDGVPCLLIGTMPDDHLSYPGWRDIRLADGDLRSVLADGSAVDPRVRDAVAVRNVVGATPSADTTSLADGYVAVRLITAGEAEDADDDWFDNPTDSPAMFFARRWGLLREETPAERYTRETGKEATPEVIAALEWAEARHG